MPTPEQMLAVARWVTDPRYDGWEIGTPPYHADHGVWAYAGGGEWRQFNPLADTTEGKAQALDVWMTLKNRLDLTAEWSKLGVSLEWREDGEINQLLFCCSDAAAILEAASYAIEKGLVK